MMPERCSCTEGTEGPHASRLSIRIEPADREAFVASRQAISTAMIAALRDSKARREDKRRHDQRRGDA
jgi:hypothetical protein